jgi:hypothetical protein
MPHNGLAIQNTGEQTQRKARQAWKEGTEKILKRRGNEWEGVRRRVRDRERWNSPL